MTNIITGSYTATDVTTSRSSAIEFLSLFWTDANFTTMVKAIYGRIMITAVKIVRRFCVMTSYPKTNTLT